MAEYLLEIGCEELPPKASDVLRNHFLKYFEERFKDFFIMESPDNIKVYSTPRRLGVYLKNIREKTPSQTQIIVGPPYKVSVDQEGKFTKAALLFAQKNDIPVEKLEKITKDKGEYIGAKVEKEGKSIKEYIKLTVPEVFDSLPSLKSMRWNDSGFLFPRPIRWIVSLLDDNVVEFEISGIKASNFTYLHRFMTSPVGRGEKKVISRPSEYEEILKMGFVIPDFEGRRKSIETQITGFAKTISSQAILDKDLIDEVTDITEFPVGIMGDFSPEYLTMPDEVIITVCRHHQRYFNYKKDGKLVPKFLAFSNNAVKDKDILRKGYEKVLKARLEDALFFYKEDLKRKLDANIERLKSIQFHEKLGSVYDKVERNLVLAKKIAQMVGYRDIDRLYRACLLSKTDLLTEMVKEFDELQGIMGMHYAIKQGEDEEVARAIFEHYLPRYADDILPDSTLGTILSLADKLDSVISFISIGQIPKATADPFAVRRNAIGVIKILITKDIDLDISEITDRKDVLEFINSRVESFLISENYPLDIINGVMAIPDYNPLSIYKKVKALSDLKSLPDYEKIVAVFKRIGNIVPAYFKGEVVEDLFEKDQERELFKKISQIKPEFESMVNRAEYTQAVRLLLDLKPYIDNFFDNVMVMVEDMALRNNRLSLLKEIDSMFRKIADFTKIIGG